MQYAFGIGGLWATSTLVSNPTPGQFGTIQDVSLDIDFDVKSLMGQYQAPVAFGRGSQKITGKAKAAKITATLFNSVFFGQSVATGNTLTQINESGTVPGSSAYTVTVANSSNFVEDLGVRYGATGVQLTRVASGPAAGQYSVSSGVYTFASGDANAVVRIDYTYTNTGGSKIILNNQLMGSQPEFSMTLSQTFRSTTFNMRLNYVTSKKLALAFKNEDFMIPEFDFMAGADASGVIGTVWTTE